MNNEFIEPRVFGLAEQKDRERKERAWLTDLVPPCLIALGGVL